MSTPLEVLIIEDEPQMRRFLRASMSPNDFRVSEAATGAAGIEAAIAQNPGLILLDLGLPDIDGLEVTKRLREWGKTPIIILSARQQDADKVAALDAGADDYLTKPFSLPELLARIRVARRRMAPGEAHPVVSVGNVRIDLGRRLAFRSDEEVKLTAVEFKLLATLARNAGRVMTHQQILKEVWGPQSMLQKQYLHVYIGHLRRKLEPDPTRPKLLLTDVGVGYRLNAE